VKRTVHRALLRVFRRLPTRLRIAAVHLLSPSYTVGAMCVIERGDGAVLFVRHSYRPRWGVPGGLCRSGEEVADGARQFSENLQTAARWYEKRDQAAADAITKIEIPK